METPFSEDKSSTRIRSWNEALCQSKFNAEVDSRRLLNEQRIWAAIDCKVANAVRSDNTSETTGPLKEAV